MKKYNIRKIIYRLSIVLSVFLLVSCEEFLEEEVYVQYDPDAFLQDQAGIDALLTGVYAAVEMSQFVARDYYQILNEFNTDIAFESDGGLERFVLPVQQFNFNPAMPFIEGTYNRLYAVIARANNVLLVTSELETLAQEEIDKINAEARFLRGYGYYLLHNLFGPTPIIEIPLDASLEEIEAIGKETPRATEEVYRQYVEDDLLFAAETLEAGGVSTRVNKGVAYAMLTKFYLNNKEWQKAADAASEVLSLNYQLYPDIVELFSVNGENNNEYIFRTECVVGTVQTNRYMAHAFPFRFRTQPNWVNFGAQFRTYTAFYETFETQDLRKTMFLTEYVPNNTTDTTFLVRDTDGNALDQVRSFKYIPDPDAQGTNHGNDIPIIRLADIMLSRAEALNELNGPNQESIDLINEIRARANASLIDLANYPDEESLNEFILAERAREFFTEGLRREDLIRHGKFIEGGIARGYPAQPFHVLYPIPQAQLDNNPNLEQNEGYN